MNTSHARIAALGLVATLPFLTTCARGPENRNLVLISIDTLRADHLGSYGYEGPTSPNLDRLAAEGVRFENVVSPVPLTLPAHASMFTGLYPPAHGVHDNLSYRLADEQLTLAEVLRDRGYATAAFVSSFVLDERFGVNQGFSIYQDDFEQARQIGNVIERRCDETARLASEWLAQPREKPFFAFVHFYDPHDTYDPPPEYLERFPDSPYAGEVAFADACVGEVLDALSETGADKNTVVAVTGDHGEMLGEHGEATHGFFIYRSALRVPLILRVPGLASSAIGSVRSQPVSLIDLFPSLSALVGFPNVARTDGVDFSDTLHGSSDGAEESRPLYAESLTANRYYGANALYGVVTDTWKFIHTTRKELFDITDDPEEATNKVSEQPRLVEGFERQLSTWLGEAERADAAQLSASEQAQLSSLGYFGGTATPGALDLDADGDDPKDLIDFYNAHQKLEDFVSEEQWSDALSLAESLTSERPSFRVGWLHLAKTEHALGNYESAVGHYRRAVELEPEDRTTRLALGEELSFAGDLDAAAAVFASVVEQHPELTDARLALAQLYQRLGRSSEAQALMATLADTGGTDAAGLVASGIGLAASGQPDLARQRFESALSQDPSFVDAHLQLARLSMSTGEHEDAENHFSRASELEPTLAEPVHGLGLALRARGKLEQAQQAFERALTIDPEYAPAHNDLGVIFKQLGNADQARVAYERALRYDPNFADAYNNLGSLLGAQGRMDAAIGRFRRAVELSPSHEQARNNLGLALRMTGKRDEAAEHFRAALSQRANWPVPMNELAWILATHPVASKRNPGEAVRLAEQAADLTGSRQPVFLDTLAAAYAAAGRFDDAVRVSERAITLAKGAGQAPLAGEFERRLALYQSGNPYVEAASVRAAPR